MFLFGIAFVRIVGVPLFGTWVAFESVFRPLGVLCGFGGRHLAVKEMSEAEVSGDSTRVTALWISVGSLSLCAGLILFLFAGAIASALGGLEGLSSLIRWGWFLPGSLALGVLLQGRFVSQDRTATMFAVTNVAEPIARIAGLGVLFLTTSLGVQMQWWGVAVPEFFAIATGLVLLGLGSTRRSGARKAVLTGQGRELAAAAGGVFRLGLPLTFHSAAGVVMQHVDKLAVAAILASADLLAAYGVSILLSGLILMFHQNLVTSVSPVISRAIARGDIGAAREVYRDSARLGFILAACAWIGMILLAPELLGLYDPSFTSFVPVVAVLASGHLVSALAGCGGYLLIVREKPKYLLYNSVFTGFAAIALNLLLIPIFGVMGAAIATASSYIIKNALIVIQNWMIDGLHPLSRESLVWVLLVAGAGGAYFTLHLYEASLVTRWSLLAVPAIALAVGVRGDGASRFGKRTNRGDGDD